MVGIKLNSEKIPLEESLAELDSLARTAGAAPVAVLTQARLKPDQKYFIGTGKVDELRALCGAQDADLIIFDHEVSPSQIRNLEETLGIKVIDRTELILDIFAQHARTREGVLQVELAQAEFTLSRLTGRYQMLSRLGGGIGTRGPGETKLEMDRRRIRKNISLLKKELEEVRKNRHLLREKRKSSQILTGALIGYTNAGKSTLLNALSHATIQTANQLFTTLDPVTRRIYLPEGKVVLLTDTVGFIQKLPHQLIDAFRATLEEVTEADFLVHVVDSSARYIEDQMTVVLNLLRELKAVNQPILTVFNKMDKLESPKQIEKLLKKYQPAVCISALNKTGWEDWFKALAQLPWPPP